MTDQTPAEPQALVDAIAYALARAQLVGPLDTSRDYAKRLAPLVIESGYLASRESGEAGLDVEAIYEALPDTEADWRPFWHRVDDPDGWVVSIYGLKLAEYIAARLTAAHLPVADPE